MTFQRNAQYPGFGGDSKIFWDDDAGHYVRICLGCLEDGKYRSYEWYVSPDLIHWEHTDSMYGMHECPDFFRLKLDGTGPDVGVLVCGDTSYLLGSFDGRKFTPDPIDPNRVDHWVAAHPVSEEMHPYWDRYNGHAANEAKDGWGRFFTYAYQSFSNLPNGRILRMGWLSADTPGCTSFAQCQSIPQEVTLKTTRFGPRLCQLPAPELAEATSANRFPSAAVRPFRSPCRPPTSKPAMRLTAPCRSVNSALLTAANAVPSGFPRPANRTASSRIRSCRMNRPSPSG